MTEPPTTGHATERSPQQLAAIAVVAFVAFPGTLTATASGLFVLYASPPAFATPGLAVLVAALAVCTGATLVAHHILR
jgi:hypothetical protein